ncbi:MAG TPA: FAD-dependent oxidoreductase [Thermomicrobiales bacterium]
MAAVLGLGFGAATRQAEAASADVLVVGGGVGGVAAALAALRLGKTVILTEETDWIGGQLTAQAVPPDENPWIESTGCTRSYREFRNGVRQYYKDNYALRKGPYGYQYLNPGAGNVSAICHEAPVALAVLVGMLKPFVASGKLTILLNHTPTAASPIGDKIPAVTFAANSSTTTIEAKYILDATELGDLLPLANIEHVTGAESKAQTDEPQALATADPLDQQAISWCFPLEYIPGENFTISKPNHYDFWRNYKPSFWLGSNLLSWTDVHPETLQKRTRYLFEGQPSDQYGDDLWHFRRIFWHSQCLSGVYPSDLTLVNWPQIDYWVNPDTRKGDPVVQPNTPGRNQSAFDRAKELSLSMLYWMQTEAPHKDGGKVGFPGLRLRPDLVGTGDGLAKMPYIRESRRIKAKFTVLEQHVGVKARQDRGLPARAEVFLDSVGVGYYRIDLHPSTGKTISANSPTTLDGRTYVDVASYPFQIPLGAFVQQQNKVTNFLPAAKNIGTTHITNGCYRLHPVEWNIGEAAGALAAFCIDRGTTPAAVRNDGNPTNSPLLRDFQSLITNTLGFVLQWPAVLPQENPDGRQYGGGG